MLSLFTGRYFAKRARQWERRGLQERNIPVKERKRILYPSLRVGKGRGRKKREKEGRRLV